MSAAPWRSVFGCAPKAQGGRAARECSSDGAPAADRQAAAARGIIRQQGTYATALSPCDALIRLPPLTGHPIGRAIGRQIDLPTAVPKSRRPHASQRRRRIGTAGGEGAARERGGEAGGGAQPNSVEKAIAGLRHKYPREQRPRYCEAPRRSALLLRRRNLPAIRPAPRHGA